MEKKTKGVSTPLGIGSMSKRLYNESVDDQQKSIVTTRIETCQNFSCWMCTMIIVILFIAGLAIGFFILLSQPNPTVTTTQGVAPGDTVPLYYANQNEIPGGGSRIWYESLTVGLEKDDRNQIVSVFLAKGNTVKNVQTCAPPDDNIQTKSGVDSLEVNLTHPALTRPFFLTIGSTISLNLTIESASDGAMLQLYVLNNVAEFDRVRDGSQPEGKPHCFNVSSGSHESINQLTSLSGYYSFYFFSDKSVRLTYSYEATTRYYNHTDYSEHIIQSCSVTEGNVCTLKIIGDIAECAYVYSEDLNDVDVIPLKVIAHHRQFNFISIVFLALFVASLGLLLACLLSTFVMHCFQRRSRKSGYSKLT